MFSLSPTAPPNHSKVMRALKIGFIFRGLFGIFFSAFTKVSFLVSWQTEPYLTKSSLGDVHS